MMETLAHLCQLLKIENCVKYFDKSKVQPTFRIEDVCLWGWGWGPKT